MKVLHVAATFYPATSYGGPVVSTRDLVLAQVGLGASVRVVTTDANGALRLPQRSSNLSGAEVTYYPARPLNSYGVSMGLWKAILNEVSRADVVHLHGVFLPSTSIGLWACRHHGTPAVVSPHGALMRWALLQRRWRKQIYGLVDRKLLAKSHFLATSKAEGDDLIALGFKSVKVVPNGVDSEYFEETRSLDIRAKLGLPSESVIVAWLGRLHEVKNLGVLIDATRDLGVHLVLAGHHDSAYGQALRDKVRGQGRQDVHFVGHLEGDTKRALLQQADVYAHPSLMESFGMSIAEALASGCPVVASNQTPWSQLDSQGAGRWVPPEVGTFRDAISSILHGSREDLRRAARKVVAPYAWPQAGKAVLAAYSMFLSRRTS